MPDDYRSDPMESPEGQGRAKRAWDAYVKTVNRYAPPFIRRGAEEMVKPVARQAVEDAIGFWVMWHLYGGFEGLQEFGLHKSTIWRKVSRFRSMTGFHPDVFELPGVNIDPAAYWASTGTKVGPPPPSQ